MRRHIAQPLDAGGLHRGIGVEALGDGMGDDGLPLFLEQRDQLFLLRHQRVDLAGLAVEEGGDGGRWKVRLSWDDAPTVDLLVGFDGLATSPKLIGVGGGPHSGSGNEADPASDSNSQGGVAQ